MYEKFDGVAKVTKSYSSADASSGAYRSVPGLSPTGSCRPSEQSSLSLETVQQLCSCTSSTSTRSGPCSMCSSRSYSRHSSRGCPRRMTMLPPPCSLRRPPSSSSVSSSAASSYSPSSPRVSRRAGRSPSWCSGGGRIRRSGTGSTGDSVIPKFGGDLEVDQPRYCFSCPVSGPFVLLNSDLPRYKCLIFGAAAATAVHTVEDSLASVVDLTVVANALLVQLLQYLGEKYQLVAQMLQGVQGYRSRHFSRAILGVLFSWWRYDSDIGVRVYKAPLALVGLFAIANVLDA